MKYLYDSHTGGFYTSKYKLNDKFLYCSKCGDSDSFIGEFTTPQELWNLVKNRVEEENCPGYPFNYIYKFIAFEFELRIRVNYSDDEVTVYDRFLPREEMQRRIDELIELNQRTLSALI